MVSVSDVSSNLFVSASSFHNSGVWVAELDAPQQMSQLPIASFVPAWFRRLSSTVPTNERLLSRNPLRTRNWTPMETRRAVAAEGHAHTEALGSETISQAC